MVGWVLLLVVILAIPTLYMIIPDFLFHRLGIGSSKRHYNSGVAITFDDGPDPVYTPEILDILARHQVPATFFVVGEKALKYPELVHRILAEGHQLGLHSQQHLHAWVLNPRKTWRLWDEGAATLEMMTGQRVELIRPPWGTFNLALWYWLKRSRRRAVLWNVEGHDWLNERSPQQISSRVLKKAKAGAIIVLHDSGGEKGAPENTIKALSTLCQKLKEEQKLTVLPLEFPSWPLGRLIAITLWEKWEGLFSRINRVERISAHNLLRLTRKQYKGSNLYSQDGQLVIKPGDWVGEIHFDNTRFLRKATDSHGLGIQTLHDMKESLSELAIFISQKHEYEEIKAFMGLTLINRGAKGLGFHIEEVPHTVSIRGIALLQRMILRVYHPRGKTRAMKERRNQPKLLWISKEELLEKWLKCS